MSQTNSARNKNSRTGWSLSAKICMMLVRASVTHRRKKPIFNLNNSSSTIPN